MPRTMIRLVLAIAATLIVTGPAYAMMRVNKYRPLTKIRDTEVCVFTKHETNPKKENAGHILNGTAPIVCQLSVYAEAVNGKRTRIVKRSLVKEFAFGELTESCVGYGKLKKKEKVKALYALTTACTTTDSAPRVFADYKALTSTPPTVTKGEIHAKN